MIIRELRLRAPGRENLRHLINYLQHGRQAARSAASGAALLPDRGTRSQSRAADAPDLRSLLLPAATARVACTLFHNLPADLDLAPRLMLRTAQVNTRARSRFLHLIISLPPAQELREGQWQQVLSATAAALGMSDHQALGFVHHDTDCQHLHAIFNTISPVTGRRASLSHSRRRLHRLVPRLEQELGLTAGDAQQVPEVRQRQSGVTPELPQALQRRLTDQAARTAELSTLPQRAADLIRPLQSATTWEECHELLAAAGLAFAKGRGLSISDGRQRLPCSALARSLSLSAMVKRLGPYTPPARPPAPVPSPRMPAAFANAALAQERYALFASWQQQQMIRRCEAMEHEECRYATAYRLAGELQGPDAARQTRRELTAAHHGVQQQIRRTWPLCSFKDYLMRITHDSELLATRCPAPGLPPVQVMPLNHALGAAEPFAGSLFTLSAVTGNGTRIYTSDLLPGEQIRSRGGIMAFTRRPALLTIAQGLEMNRRANPGGSVHICGDERFQNQCALVAARIGVSITLSLPAAQRLYDQHREGLKHVRTRSRHPLSRAPRRAAAVRAAADLPAALALPHRAGAAELRPPEPAAHPGQRLPALSAGRVAGVDDQGAVLLSRARGDQLGFQQPPRNRSALRRHVPPRAAGDGNTGAEQALTAFIRERNARHALQPDNVCLHRRLSDLPPADQARTFIFTALRQLRDPASPDRSYPAALLQERDIIYVMPLSEAQRQQLAALRRHTRVTLSAGELRAAQGQGQRHGR